MLPRRLRSAVAMPVGVVLSLATGACSGGGSGGATGMNGGSATDFHQQLSDAFFNVPGFQDAFQRLVKTLDGSPQPGVTLTMTSSGITGSDSADIAGRGMFDTQINGQFTYINPQQGLAGGANFTLSSINGGAPQTASGSGVVTQTGPSTLTISSGAMTTVTQTRKNHLSISGANLTVDVSGPKLVVTGPADFTFNGLHGTMTFESDGQGGFKISVSGSGFTTFTVP
jgi:hypothetical protein